MFWLKKLKFNNIFHNCWGNRIWLVYNKNDVSGGVRKSDVVLITICSQHFSSRRHIMIQPWAMYCSTCPHYVFNFAVVFSDSLDFACCNMGSSPGTVSVNEVWLMQHFIKKNCYYYFLISYLIGNFDSNMKGWSLLVSKARVILLLHILIPRARPNLNNVIAV